MGAFDIAVIVTVSVAFAAVVGIMIWRKVKHKGGCDCGCGTCAGCAGCRACKNTDKKN